ncbi:hypothetical protein AB0K20_11445 [Micromonospora matsumotoense]|uniref:hypothetical protein n=1 Tax=Micromonospora matsumotoense TaxID=121616 RepID=UPI00343B3151
MSDGGSNDIPDLGPPPERIAVDVDQVRRLVASQFPHWADLPVERVANGGWDNWAFHLGPGMSVRLPSALEYAEAVDKEHTFVVRNAGTEIVCHALDLAADPSALLAHIRVLADEVTGKAPARKSTEAGDGSVRRT